MRNPRDGMESTSLTDSTASREEEERHRRLLCENENLKKQIAEVSYMFLVGVRNYNYIFKQGNRIGFVIGWLPFEKLGTAFWPIYRFPKFLLQE